MIQIGLQLLSSGLTLWAMWLMGDKKLIGPWVALASELVWLAVIYNGALWGFLPLTLCFMVIHGRNIILWRREAATDNDVVAPGWSDSAHKQMKEGRFDTKPRI